MTFRLPKALSVTLLALCCSLNLLPLSALADVPVTSLRNYGALPQVSLMRISPAGDRIAYRSTKDGRDLAVVVSLKDGKHLASLDLSEITPRSLYFATEDELILVVSNVRWLFNYREKMDISTAYAYNLKNRELRQLLTPGRLIYQGQTGLGRIVGLSADKKHVFMPAYVPDNKYDNSPRMSLVDVDLDSPRRPRVYFKGLENSVDFFLDGKGRVIAHEIFDNRRDYHKILALHGDEWEEIYRKETAIMNISVVGLTPDRKSLVVIETNDDTGRDDYYTLSLKDGTFTNVGLGRDDADIEVTYKGLNRVVWGVRYSGFSPSYKFFDPDIDRRMRAIQAIFPEHSVWLRDWSEDWSDLIVYVEGSQLSGNFYKFSRGKDPVELAAAHPLITAGQINPIGKMRYRARDGMVIPNLLTIPRNHLDEMKDLPAVVMPHGGPAAYDQVGFDWLAQALASRGYLVIQPQFRGSAGFGRDHLVAGHGEWGRKMQDDLTDAVQVMVNKGMVDPERICIVGGSYGGYAALAGGAFTPDLYRCVVSINGVADLQEMLDYEEHEHGDDHWSVAYWQENIGRGDVSSEKLEQISPALHAEDFTAPVLLIHGENDLNVPFAQSKEMYKALKRAEKPVELIELEGENHNLLQGETRLQTVEAVVAFVDQHLQK